MLSHLKCYVSASFDVDILQVEIILQNLKIETYNFYDGSIGLTFQELLKRKLRQVDFAIFILSKNNKNVIYEIGVCEGLGKQSLILVDKEYGEVPFYLENKLLLNVNLADSKAIDLAISAFVKELPVTRKKPEKAKYNRMASEQYDENIKEIFRSLLVQTRNLRDNGNAIEMEYIVEEVFKTLRMKYIQGAPNNNKGVDFAIWNDRLGRIIGNPIIVECKYGTLNQSRLNAALEQLFLYSENSGSSVGILLYLDTQNNRFDTVLSSKHLSLVFDLEDFLDALIDDTFESIILSRRNFAVHNQTSK